MVVGVVVVGVCFLLMILIALKIKLLGAFQLNMEEMSVLTMKRELEKNGEEIINSMAKQVLYEFSTYSFIFM